GVAKGEFLSDHTPQRQADDVGRSQGEGVEQADDVVRQLGDGVGAAGVAGLADVAVIEGEAAEAGREGTHLPHPVKVVAGQAGEKTRRGAVAVVRVGEFGAVAGYGGHRRSQSSWGAGLYCTTPADDGSRDVAKPSGGALRLVCGQASRSQPISPVERTAS